MKPKPESHREVTRVDFDAMIRKALATPPLKRAKKAGKPRRKS